MTNALLGLITQFVSAVIGLTTIMGWWSPSPGQISAVMLVIAGAWAIVMYINTYVAGKAKAIREAAANPTKTTSVPLV